MTQLLAKYAGYQANWAPEVSGEPGEVFEHFWRAEGERHEEKVLSNRGFKEINDFLERCEQEVQEVAGPHARERTLQGPDGVCSVQTSQDIKFTMQTLERICSTLHEISLSLLDSVNLKSLTALFVENLFAEMR